VFPYPSGYTVFAGELQTDNNPVGYDRTQQQVLNTTPARAR